MRGDIACHAIHFDEIGRAQCRGSEEIVEGSGGRAIAFVTDGLISDNRKVIKAGLYPQVVEKLNVYFHELNPIFGGGMTQSPPPVRRWRILFHTNRRSGANILMRWSINRVKTESPRVCQRLWIVRPERLLSPNLLSPKEIRKG
jgi:hypothetical protein